MGVHRSTLWRKVNKYLGNEELKYSDINDEYLDRIITEIKNNHPLSGERVIVGLIHSRGIHIPKARIRASIHRVDPVNAALWWIRKNQDGCIVYQVQTHSGIMMAFINLFIGKLSPMFVLMVFHVL